MIKKGNDGSKMGLNKSTTSKEKEVVPEFQKCQKPLRACFVYYMLFNNSALLYREARSLKEKGFEIDVIALRCMKKHKVFQTFDGLNIYGIQARPSAEKNFITYFTRLLLFFLKATLLQAYLGLKKKYELVHITAPPDFMVFTAIIPKLLGAKIILDIHDISPELFMEKLHINEDRLIIKMIKHIEQFSSKFADHVITVTDIWRNRLISRSVAQSKCTVLLNVPDENLFKPFSLIKKNNSNGFNLFYHGSLEEYFGVDTLLKSMLIIEKNIPDVKLYIYGGGRLKQEFETFIQESKLDHIIKICDKVPFYKLPEILANADLGIVPTKDTNFSDDTISMKALEYMALGIPIVISKTKAHRFYFDDSMVQFFQPEDKNELALSVIKLYQDEQKRKRIINSSQIFIQKYGWAKSKEIYLQIVDRLIWNNSELSL